MSPPIRIALVAAAFAVTVSACGKNFCPEDSAVDRKRSKGDRVVFCVNRTDASRALWIELHDRKTRKQVCPFVGGRPGGSYQAWHKDGARLLEGRYAGGLKVGRWVQWAPDGRVVGDGEYRDGQLVQGAPVGAAAPCEMITW